MACYKFPRQLALHSVSKVTRSSLQPMMGFKEFQIVLDSPVCYAGQNLTGKLLVELKRPRKIKGIYVKYFGRGSVQWSEGWGTSTVTHSNTEVYLTEYQLVFGNETEESELAEGKRVFNFNCQLPNELPSSFEGLFGRVRYSVRVTLDQPWKNDYVAKQPMTIISVFDLNHCSVASAPVRQESCKTFWGQSKPLFMSVDIPVHGFVPGQIIPIKVFLNNESEVQVKSLEATLKQNIVFHATMKSSPMKLFLLRTETPIEEGLGCREVMLSVGIPSLPPSYLQFCNIIDLKYQLNVKAKVSGVHRSLKVPVEVIIGNIPPSNCEMSVSNHHLLYGLPLDPEIPSCSQTLPPPYTVIFPAATVHGDLPPPSYDQIAGLGSDDEQRPEYEAREFAPLYSVCNFETTRVRTTRHAGKLCR